MIDDLVQEIAGKTRLDARQAQALLAGALALIKRHADPARVGELFAATPGAEAMAGSIALPKPGLFGGMMKAAGGGAMADGMAMLQQLSKAGVASADLQAALPIASAWVEERTGRDLLGEALASIPGVGGMIGKA